MSDSKSFSEASALYDEGDYPEAFELFLRLAERGDSGAMLRVATMISSGEGVKYDLDAAIAWEEKAVQHGSKTALLNLGISYRCKGDITRARDCFLAALKHGDGEAALELARLFRISSREVETVRLYASAALESENITDESREAAEVLLRELSG